MRRTRDTASSDPSTCTASERRSIRTPRESSISLRFSSRVPKRGSRFGVISNEAFRGPPDLLLKQTAVGPQWLRQIQWKFVREVFAGSEQTGAHDLRFSCAASDWRQRPRCISGERVAPPALHVNPAHIKIHQKSDWSDSTRYRYLGDT
jgi:hypothetical protein